MRSVGCSRSFVAKDSTDLASVTYLLHSSKLSYVQSGHPPPSTRIRVLRLRIRQRHVRNAKEALFRDLAIGILVDLPDVLRKVADRDEHAAGRSELIHKSLRNARRRSSDMNGLPPSLGHEPIGSSVPPIRSNHLHGPAPLLIPFTDRTSLIGAERRSGGMVASKVLPREGDQFGKVVDPEDGAARLDERVEESAQVAGAGTDVEDIGSRFQERLEVLDSVRMHVRRTDRRPIAEVTWRIAIRFARADDIVSAVDATESIDHARRL